MRNTGLEKRKLESRLPGEISITWYADNIILLAKSEEELKRVLMKVSFLKNSSHPFLTMEPTISLYVEKFNSEIKWLNSKFSLDQVSFIKKATGFFDEPHKLSRFIRNLLPLLMCTYFRERLLIFYQLLKEVCDRQHENPVPGWVPCL